MNITVAADSVIFIWTGKVPSGAELMLRDAKHEAESKDPYKLP